MASPGFGHHSPLALEEGAQSLMPACPADVPARAGVVRWRGEQGFGDRVADEFPDGAPSSAT